MKASNKCYDCLFIKHLERAKGRGNDKTYNEFIKDLKDVMYGKDNAVSTSVLVYRIDRLYEKHFGSAETFEGVNSRYNKFMLERESIIEKEINASADKIKSCIEFSLAGNYIDFGTNPSVSESVLEKLLKDAKNQSIDVGELSRFKKDLEKAKTVLFLLDNCGEIVIDKIFIKIIKALYPKKQIVAMVRGGKVLNDATKIDAKEIGLDKVCKVIDNGYATPGADPYLMSEEALDLMKSADLIISKGQGNFESLYGEKFNPYFLFLCKCELFVEKFGLKMFSPIFCKENNIKVKF